MDPCDPGLQTTCDASIFAHGLVLKQQYTLGKQIAHTNMSSVFHATNAYADEPVAIKIFECDQTCPELAIHTRLSHPNIVAVLDHFQVCQFHCIVMPFAQYGSLQSLMRRHPLGLKPKTAKAVFSQMLSSVSYLHRKGIIHNDIKLENFLVFDASDASPHVALTDFGTARVADFLCAENGCAPGTIEYASPEVCTNEPWSSKSDMWALGVALYTLLCGRRPFDAPRTVPRRVRCAKICECIVNRRLAFPAKVWDDLEKPRRLIDRMIVLDPVQRVSADEALGDEWLKRAVPRLASCD